MKRAIDVDLLEARLSFLPERLLNAALFMFTSPRRASAWIGMMTSETIELAARHQPSPDDVERLKAVFVETFPEHDLESGEHRILSGTPVMYPIEEICTHVYG